MRFIKYLHGIILLGSLALLSACYGGGTTGDAFPDGDDSYADRPWLQYLSLSPSAVYENDGGGQQDIIVSSRFVDSDGNLRSGRITVRDSGGQIVSSATIAISGINGLTEGTIHEAFTVNITAIDRFKVQFYVTDASNLRSNTVESNFRVSQFPWASKSVMPTRRSGFATATLNGLIYVIGGMDANAPVTPKPVVSTVEIYNPSTDSWTTGPSLPVALSGQMAAAVNDKIYAIGGEDTFQTDIVQEFDPVSQSWTLRTSMPDQRSSAAVATHNGIIYIAGGLGIGLSQFASLLLYNPIADSWGAGSPMSQARVGPGGAVIGGKFLVYGGYNTTHVPDGGYIRSLENYDPTMDIWTTKISGEPRRSFGVGVIGGYMYAIGGSNVARSLDQVSAYDYFTDRWFQKTPMPASLASVHAEVIGDKIYIFETDHTFEYTPASEIR